MKYFLIAIILAIFAVMHITADIDMLTAAQREHLAMTWELFNSRRDFDESNGVMLGVDVSQLHTVSKLRCMYDKGYHFFIPRGFRSSGTVDPNVLQNIANAKGAGFSEKNIDVYLFPEPKGSASPAKQIDTLYKHVGGAAFKGLIWIDIEGSSYWTGNHAKNREWLLAMVAEAVKQKIPIGLYVNQVQYNAIFGSDWKPTNLKYPLWVARYSSTKTCSDLAEFGPYKRSDFTIRQHQGTTSLCGGSVDLSAYCQ